MRILLMFFLGGILSFYLSEIAALANRKHLKLNNAWGIHHSQVGLGLLVLGITSSIFHYPWMGTPWDALISTFIIGAGSGMIFHHLLSESFVFSERLEKNFIHKHDSQVERFLEILPGALTWLVLTSPIWLSYTLPFAVAYIILLADFYWLFNAFKISALILIGYRKLEQAKKTNWLKRLKDDFPDEWENYYHFIEIHSYKEPLEVLLPAYNAILNSNYPAKKIFFGIGVEERANPETIARVEEYAKRNSDRIGGIFFTVHPYGLPGEITGPAAHRNWIMNNAVKEFAKRKIDLKQVIVTTLDADFVIHPQFLAGALHKYLSTPAQIRDKRSFTGVFLYNNNYWDCPAPMRLIATGTAFWQLAEMVGSDKYINFSSLSINMQSLIDIGMWMPNKVNDDSGFFWKAYYHFNGDYKVIPHYLPITADAVLDVSLAKTFDNQYQQLKRWAYGVEHVPFIVRKYFTSRHIDFWDKTDKLFFIMWSYTKWGTLALFITFAGMLIPLINPGYSQSVVAYNLPIISSWILTAAFIGLFTTVYAHEKLVPKRPASWSLFQRVWSYLQWTLIPLILVTIASLPAIEAQTRLMLGKYLEYRTTNKARASKN